MEAHSRRVLETEVGYANSTLVDPTYEEVFGETGAAEAVRVIYDADVLPLPLLLAAYLRTVDPFSLNRQGNDRGTQYRTGIYWTDDADRAAVTSALRVLRAPVAATCASRRAPAELRSRRGLPPGLSGPQPLRLLPREPRRRPRLRKRTCGRFRHRRAGYARPSDVRRTLTPEAFDVTQRAATDRPHTHPYDQQFEDGIYVDVVTGEPLFSLRDKFDAGCGWPSFARPLAESVIEESLDESIPRYALPRGSAQRRWRQPFRPRSSPTDRRERGGQRYCINGSAPSALSPPTNQKPKATATCTTSYPSASCNA